MLTCQAKCTFYICHPPTCPPSPGISLYILHAKPHGIIILKVQAFVEGPKTKNPSLVPGISLYFFSPAVRRGGGEEALFPVYSDPRAFPGLCSKPWQTSKADTDGSCLEWWRQNQTTSSPKFLSSQAEEEAVRTQPITPQNGNLRCLKLKGINSTAKPLGRSRGCFSFSLSQQQA